MIFSAMQAHCTVLPSVVVGILSLVIIIDNWRVCHGIHHTHPQDQETQVSALETVSQWSMQ